MLLLLLASSGALFGRADAHAGTHHACGHSRYAERQAVHHMPPAAAIHAVEEPAGGGTTEGVQIRRLRSMHAQSAATNSWSNLRVVFNWTFVDQPTLDVRPNSGSTPSYLSCFSGGPTSVFVGSPTSSPEYCFDQNTWEHRFIDNCLMGCNASSTPTSADIARLKTISNQVGAKFSSALMAERIAGEADEITVVSDALRDCGEMRFGPFAAAQTDIIIYATVRPLLQTGGTIAFASSCGLHPTTSRPILAHMNVAPETIKNNPNLYNVLLHELTHALGFTPSVYGFYRHPSDRTKTYYEYDPVAFPTGPIKGTGAVYDSTAQPPRPMVRFTDLAANPGSKLYFIGANAVAKMAEQSACATLTGVELENGGNASSSTGSHWEMRVLMGEYMVSQQSDVMVMSPVTLGLFADMGFYQPVYSEGAVVRWGYHKGCAWVTSKCDTWDERYFCRGAGSGCGFDYSFVGNCKYSTTVPSIAAPYQYFPQAASPATTGGTDVFADYCPYYNRFGNVPLCTEGSAVPSLGTSPGASGQCFETNVTINKLQGARHPDCFRMICNSSDLAAASVRIGNLLVPCRDGQLINLHYLPRHPNAGLIWTFDDSRVTHIKSAEYAGTFWCGTDIATRCQQNRAFYNLLATSDINHPTITGVLPAEGSIAGGTKINITGTHLDTCRDVRVGGVWAVHVERVSPTQLVATLGAVTESWQGGAGLDGIGQADVEIMCNVSQACPEGCVAGRHSSFTLVREDTPAVDLASAIENFLDTTTGKVVGGAVAFVVVVVIFCIIRSCLADSDSASSSTLKDPLARLDMNQLEPMDRQRGRRADFDDDDLL